MTQIIGLATVVAVLIAGCGSGSGDLARPAQTQGQGVVAAAGQPAHAGHGGAQAVAAPITPLRSGERFRTLWMPRAYIPSPPAHGTDDYRCFLVDPKLTTDAFLTGSQFLPNNASIVHHAIFFKVDQQDVGQARALDAASSGDGWTCFSGTGIGSQGDQLQGAPWLAAWAPGSTESLAAKGTGTRMEAGSLGLPPWLQALAGHMHLLGRSIKVQLNPGTTKARTLLDVPVYNFDDQGARALAKPISVKAGDDLRVTCTHDATLRSQIPALQTLKPRYVVWGEGTSDEMCLGVVIWSARPAVS